MLPGNGPLGARNSVRYTRTAMFTHLRVENLKCFADSGLLKLRPLTFFMGPNSSGKSTLLQAILLVRQTVDSLDVRNPIVVDDGYVKLGSYREFIHKHERGRRLSLEFGLSAENLRIYPEPSDKIDILSVRAEFSYNQKTLQIFPTSVSYKTQPALYQISKKRLTPRDSSLDIEYVAEKVVVRQRVSTATKFYDLGSTGFFPRRRASIIRKPDQRITKRAEEELLRRAWRIPLFFADVYEMQFRKTFYVGPLRTGPQRTYVAAGETPQDVGLEGESTFAVLWAARWNRPLKDRVFRPANEWLQRFGIAAKLELKRIGGSYFTLLVTDPTLKIQTNFADIGFGASQLLPALVEVLYAPEGATIIMEQPEIHLHPAAQGVLGDLFADQAMRGKQIIVETHSEHLVSRVLTRVAEGNFPADDIVIYYCEPSKEGTQIRDIAVDDFGRLGEGLPSGFFDQSYAESRAHVEAIARKSEAASGGRR